VRIRTDETLKGRNWEVIVVAKCSCDGLKKVPCCSRPKAPKILNVVEKIKFLRKELRKLLKIKKQETSSQ